MFVVLTVCLVLGHTGRPLARAALVFYAAEAEEDFVISRSQFDVGGKPRDVGGKPRPTKIGNEGLGLYPITKIGNDVLVGRALRPTTKDGTSCLGRALRPTRTAYGTFVDFQQRHALGVVFCR